MCVTSTAARCITSNFDDRAGQRQRAAAISARPAASSPAIRSSRRRGSIPYAINAPFWSDGATKERWLALPDGQSITVRTDGDWDFPNRTVLMKNFRVGTRLIETRLLMRHPDGIWGGFTLRVERAADATRRWSRAARARHRQRPELDLPERDAMPGVPHGRSEPRARAGNRAAQPHLHVSRRRAAPRTSSRR